MTEELITISLIAVFGVIGGALGYLLVGKKNFRFEDYTEKAEQRLEKANAEAAQILTDAKSKEISIRERNAEYEKNLREQSRRIENLINSKQEQIKKREKELEMMKAVLADVNNDTELLKKKNSNAQHEMVSFLSQKVGLPVESAKQEILATLSSDLALMKEERLNKLVLYLEDEKKRLAKDIVAEAIQRYSAPTSVEKRGLTIIVNRDEFKGKLIGPDAENLVALEELTECDIIFNDAPKTIIISCYDLFKKHIAYEAMMKLLQERVVDRQKIVQKIEEARRDMDRQLVKLGKDTAKKLELKRVFPDEFYKIIGRLQFRTSYGQNIMKHSYEVGEFALMLGAEIGANLDICRVGGFLHDLGKAIDQEVGEPHDHLTKQIMEKFNFSPEEIHAAWTHHDAIDIETAEAMLVKAGDAISAGRPGARQETLEKYLERIKALEEIANSYEGVNKSYAISAGREVRVIVEPKELMDEHLPELADHIAKEIEEKVAYPGKIKVNIIRTTKNTEVAKATTSAQG